MKTELQSRSRKRRSGFYFLTGILFLLCYLAELSGVTLSAFPNPSVNVADCAVASVEIKETGEPGKVILAITSDKPFSNLQWYVWCDNIYPWSTDSGVRWEYTGTYAEIAHQIPFNGNFTVHVRLGYEGQDSYCTVSVLKKTTVSGLSPCAASVSSTLYAKSSYEFSYQEGPGSNFSGTSLWDFGDGSTSTQYKPRHTYAADGTYVVKFTRTRNDSTSETWHTVKVGCEDVEARIISEKGEGPGLFYFTANVPQQIKTDLWTYGDGATSAYTGGGHHKYNQDGTYPVTYTATTIQGCTVTAHDIAVVSDAHLCGTVTYEIKETAQPGNFRYIIDSNKPILGTQISIAGIDAQWSYSSGTRWDLNGTHLDISPFKIPSNGPARVNMSFSYEYASGKYCYSDYRDTVEVRGYPCAATINATVQSEGIYKFSLSGGNLGKAGTGTTLWEFGDGSTSAEFQPTHAYQQAGTYQVKCTRSYFGCTATATYALSTCVSGETPVQFEAMDSSGEYKFTVTSHDPITDAYWSIDTDQENIAYYDHFGLSTNSHSITQQFEKNGTYFVWVFLFTQRGCYLEGYKTVEITNLEPQNCEEVTSDIIFSKTGPGKYTFTAECSENIQTKRTWDFGDGQTSTATNPSYQYRENGSYEVTFTGTTTGGCPVSVTKTQEVTDAISCGEVSLQVNETGEPGKFIYVIDSELPVLGTNFDIRSIEGQWAYSSGTRWDYNGTHQELSYKIPDNGPFSVSFFLQYENAPHCSIDLKDSVYVYGYPCTATITPTRLDENRYRFSVSGTNTGKPGKGSILWAFGDGTTSTEFQPVHTFHHAGEFTVTVTRTYFGCESVAYKTVTACISGESSIHTDTGDAAGQYQFSVNTDDPVTEAYWSIDSPDENIWYGEYTNLNTTSHTIDHQFEANGTYFINAYLYTKNGCYHSASETVEVNGITQLNCDSETPKINTSKLSQGRYSFTADPSDRMDDNVNWEFGTGETSNTINPEYEYAENGTYTVKFSGNTVSGCPVAVLGTLVVSGITKEEITTDVSGPDHAEDLFIYPNPTTGQIHFSRPVSGVVYNSKGNVVVTLQNEGMVNLHSAGSGMYILKPYLAKAIKIIVK